MSNSNLTQITERTAKVSDGGVGIFLAPSDLTALGVEDADQVEYVVESDGLRFRQVGDE